MTHYVCDLYGNTNWKIPVEEVAARTFNTEQKVAIFNAIGITPNYIVLSPNIAVEQFDGIVQSINENTQVTAAIVQYPIPAKFTSSIGLLEPQKDIDIYLHHYNLR